MRQRVEAGAFELQGMSGVSLANGTEVMGIRLGVPHPALGLFDGHDVLLTLDRPDVHMPDGRYARYSWRVPITPEGVTRYARWPGAV